MKKKTAVNHNAVDKGLTCIVPLHERSSAVLGGQSSLESGVMNSSPVPLKTRRVFSGTDLRCTLNPSRAQMSSRLCGVVARNGGCQLRFRLRHLTMVPKWLATLTAVPLGLGSNPGEGMDVCKCIVPSWHGSTLNSRRAASPLVRLMEEMWEAPDYPQGVLPLYWSETELNRSVTCMVFKDRRHLAPCHDEFRGP
ncbi:cullin-4A [Trichonephila clavipes]|nr:cullin-4A [Trichonephila clavipes]